MKNFKFVFFFFAITSVTSMHADLSDRAKATYYDAKVKAEDASDTIEEKYNDASDRAKATYYDTKVKAKDAYQDMVKEKEKN